MRERFKNLVDSRVVAEKQQKKENPVDKTGFGPGSLGPLFYKNFGLDPGTHGSTAINPMASS